MEEVPNFTSALESMQTDWDQRWLLRFRLGCTRGHVASDLSQRWETYHRYSLGPAALPFFLAHLPFVRLDLGHVRFARVISFLARSSVLVFPHSTRPESNIYESTGWVVLWFVLFCFLKLLWKSKVACCYQEILHQHPWSCHLAIYPGDQRSPDFS